MLSTKKMKKKISSPPLTLHLYFLFLLCVLPFSSFPEQYHLNPGSERSSGEGNGNPLQYFCLRNPMDRGNWWITIHGVTRVRHNLATKQPPLGYENLFNSFENIFYYCSTIQFKILGA